MIEAIIIDDEPKAIELLKNYCERSHDILCMKSFRNAIKALQYIETKKPQLILLDINMPNLSGIQLAKLIPAETHIVFTTAYSEYAVESYNLNATDYLLKPITYKRFRAAIDKVSDMITTSTRLTSEHPKPTLIIKSGYEKHQIEIDSILYLEKDGNYMNYHTLNKKILARETINEALEKLPNTFVQVHKSYIVSLPHIEVIDSKHVLINSNRIPMSNRYKTILDNKLG